MVLRAPAYVVFPSPAGFRSGIALISVVLPEPFGPIRPTISSSPTAKSTRSSATTPPKRQVRPAQARSGVLIPRSHGFREERIRAAVAAAVLPDETAG